MIYAAKAQDAVSAAPCRGSGRAANVGCGVNRVDLAARRLLPVHPVERTFPEFVGMSQKCQQETHALQQKASYSITSSARTSKEGGTVRPSALAVLRLITNSNLVGCSTGRSEGLVPLRILST
jgi:hypothetical protein